MTEERKGVLAMAATAAIWGLSGMFYKALGNAGAQPVEVLCHRTLWSVVFFVVVLAVQGRTDEARSLLARPRLLAVLVASAVTIAANWFLFIVAVERGHALQASLGYYIFPLFAVALGYLFLGERFGVVKSIAIGLAATAVAVLTIGLGVPPWTAVLIAATFATYGLIKNRLAIGPVISVFVETLLLAPLALAWLWALSAGVVSDFGTDGGQGVFGRDLGTSVMLAFSGPLTGGPLVLFSYAARRIPYATLGLVQYLNPTLQFVVAVAVFGEPFTRWHAIAFPLIWGGLALYSWESWRQERARAVP